MNAKRKWDMRTILLGLIIVVIIIAVIFVVFSPPGKKVISPLNVQEIMQNKDSYVDKNITVEGYYYYSDDGPSLVSATTISNPTPSIWLNLDEASLNLAKQAAGNITTINNIKYRVEGILQKVESSLGTNYYIIVNRIKAV